MKKAGDTCLAVGANYMGGGKVIPFVLTGLNALHLPGDATLRGTDFRWSDGSAPNMTTL